MGLDAAMEHQAGPDDRSLKQQTAANRWNPGSQLPDHERSSRVIHSREAFLEPLSSLSPADAYVRVADLRRGLDSLG
jgi:hypothetical protein